MRNLCTALLVLISFYVVNAQVTEPSDTVNQESNSKDTSIRQVTEPSDTVNQESNSKDTSIRQVTEPLDTVNQESNSKDTSIRYKIIKTDGGELKGEIIKQDNRELLLKTSDGREVSIPQHLISEVVKDDLTFYRIIKTDGGELQGEIIKQDNRELLLKTVDGREIYIPQHVISQIVKLSSLELNKKGEFIDRSPFATRYFMSTNGFSLDEGENYYLINWWGPEMQFGLKNNFSVGLMTTWIGAPIIGTFKKSWKIKKNTHVAIGALIGTGSYSNFDVFGGIPFAAITFGKRTRNISISCGYGAVSDNKTLNNNYPSQQYMPYQEKRITDKVGMFSFSGMCKLTRSVSFIFESFFVLPEDQSEDADFSPLSCLAVISPGFRFQHKPGKAFQVGFTGVIMEDIISPIPMVQWYRSF